MRVIMLILLGLLPSSAFAFEVSPLYIEMQPSGTNATTAMSVNNTTGQTLPLETEVIERIITTTGKETRTVDEDSFLIFPPQANIEVGKRQIFRVQWLGEPNLKTSRSFYIMFKQVPVKVTQEKTGIQFLTNIGASLHVVPSAAKSAGLVEDITFGKKDSKPTISFFVKNTSDRLWYTDSVRYSITSPQLKEAVTFSGAEIDKSQQTQLITPQGRQKLTLPLPVPVQKATVGLTFP